MLRLLTSQAAGIPPVTLLQALRPTARTIKAAASKDLQKSLMKISLSYIKIFQIFLRYTEAEASESILFPFR